VVDETEFFQRLGARVKALRRGRKFTQEDMIGYGFSARHWQQIEAGRAITLKTLLRICDTFSVRASQLIDDLDRNIYSK
jgi:transcriptional regulator with XRE-family HTH domain